MQKYLFLLFTVLCLGEIQAQKTIYGFPLGVQTYTFRRSFPLHAIKALDTIKMFGFTEIEGGAPRGMTPEDFRKACDDRGIKIPSTGTGYEQLVKDPMAVVKTAKILGASYVMCAWIPHKGNDFTIDDAKKAVEDFNTAGKVLKENGLTLCYHDHGYEFRPYEGGTLMDYIIKNTNPEYVSFEMDVLWTIHGGGDPVSLLKKYKGRWKLMHLKDLRKGVAGDNTGHTPAENDVVLGTGQANFPAILKAAKKSGVKHCFIEDESNYEMINVPKSVTYLKSLK